MDTPHSIEALIPWTFLPKEPVPCVIPGCYTSSKAKTYTGV